MKASERGAALLTVLMLVSVMAMLSATALERLRIATRLTANAGALDQARAYALAAEGIALSRITILVDADPARTPLAGGWNGRETDLPLPGGTAVAVVRDGGNCFNLNSVVDGQIGQLFRARAQGAGQLVALAVILGIGQAEAQQVAASLTDWIDSDQEALPGGGEDQAYSDADTPYRTGNTLLAHPSELRTVAGVTPEIYEKLRPWICALPTTDLSPINVNTLSPEQAPLLAMLMPDTLPPERARALLLARPPGGFESSYSFWRSAGDQGIPPRADVEAQTSVKTRWFTLGLRVLLGDSEINENALIDAGVPPARLVRRSWGEES